MRFFFVLLIINISFCESYFLNKEKNIPEIYEQAISVNNNSKFLPTPWNINYIYGSETRNFYGLRIINNLLRLAQLDTLNFRIFSLTPEVRKINVDLILTMEGESLPIYSKMKFDVSEKSYQNITFKSYQNKNLCILEKTIGNHALIQFESNCSYNKELEELISQIDLQRILKLFS